MKLFRNIGKFLPSFLTALVLAVIVWISAVNSNDPTQQIVYVNPVAVGQMGLDPDLMLTGQSAKEVRVSIRAPRSIHLRLNSDPSLITAVVNFSGQGSGEVTLKPQVQISLGPAQVTDIVPATIAYTIEAVITRDMPITLLQNGDLPSGYEAGSPILNAQTAKVSGAESQVKRVSRLLAPISMVTMTQNFSKTVELRAVDERGNAVEGISLNPARVLVEIPVKQMPGHRNVFVKVVTYGSIAQGCHLTGLSVSPPNITIYAQNPSLVADMPAFIETVPINLNGADANFEVNAILTLPEGIEVLGNPTITVKISIAPIESSVQLPGIAIEVSNLGKGLKASLSPERVDVYISGPMNLIDRLTANQVHLILDLQGLGPGVYQLTPVVIFENDSLRMDSFLPGVIEVSISK